MVYTWFIDTNIIASWVIVESNLLQKLSEQYHYPKEYHQLYHTRYANEVTFINTILDKENKNIRKNHEAFVSFLATNELFSAIRDEVLSLKLFNMGVPVSQWPREKNRIHLTNDEADFIYETALSVWDTLFGGNISIITDYDYETDIDYWDVSSRLLFTIENIKTQDVMLVTSAIMNGADYFVTRDERLIHDLKKEFLKENPDLIEVIKPATAVLKLNEMERKTGN